MLEDTAAERVVLSGIFHDSEVFEDVEVLLQSTTFTDDINQVVYKSIKHIRDEDASILIDLPLLFSVAKQIGHADIVNDKDDRLYIKQLLEMTAQPSTIKKCAGIIRKYEVARLLVNQLELAQDDVRNIKGNERIDTILSYAENRVLDFSSLLIDGDGPGYVHISDGASEYYDYLVENPRDLVGISSGYPNYDRLLGGGQQRQCVNVIAARTGVGKSMISDNIALHVAGKLGIPILYLDTEMDLKGHWHRLWANIASVPQDLIKTGKCGQNEIQDRRVRKAIDYINSIPYSYKNIAGMPFEEVVAYARKWIKKEVGKDENGNTKDCLLIYDYMKLMTSESLGNDLQEYQVLGFQMTALHNFAVKHDIPILTSVQLNKDGITKEGLEGISQSDRISWLASSVAIYKLKSDTEMRASGEYGNRKLIVVKSRHGESQSENNYINMTFEGAYASIKEGKLSGEIPKHNEEYEEEPKKKKHKSKFEVEA
jgi:replicative DNA helicase